MRSRRWRSRRSRRRRSCGASRPCSRSPPSAAEHSAGWESHRSPRRQRGQPRELPSGCSTTRRCRRGYRGRNLDEFASDLDTECEWLVSNAVLPADLVTRNREIAEAALRPWTPVFTHGDLQVCHVFVDGDEITGVVDWSEAGPGDALYDLATLTLGHEEQLDHVVAGYGREVDRDVIRGWWSLRSLLAARWLIEHGFDPSEPGCEFDVLRARM